ncbi:ABC transporter permease [Streptomyces sp. NPDC002851]
MNRTTVGSWLRDLGMGLRFAFSGGAESWVRTSLTAVGVGLGVALLLVTTAVPNVFGNRDARNDARTDLQYRVKVMPKADDTVVLARVDTEFREKDVRGRLAQPEGPNAPLPPGVSAYPKPGELIVSPALGQLLESDDNKLLRDRLPGDKIVGTIGDDGLTGPGELVFFAGADDLVPGAPDTERMDSFGATEQPEGMDPILLLLTLVVFVVLLTPVAVFIAAAVRFGGERRDRRLAALRLIGADGRMVRRVAAGEALAGALLGLVVGAGVFLGARQLAGQVEVMDVSVFPADLDPTPALALLVAVAVPVAAVAVTLFALRSVVIEPLGVVRTAKPARRRLWWRLLLPLAGLGLLYPMIGQGNERGEFNQIMVTGGVLLLLIGITALLPWLVETTVARLGAGPVAWQMAVRRLQLSSGTAARMVNGIAVAVAGAIALQMLFAGVENDYTKSTGQDTNRAQVNVMVPRSPDSARQTQEAYDRLRGTDGVRKVTQPLTSVEIGEKRKDPDQYSSLTVGSCAALREVAELPSCKEGDLFQVHGAKYDDDTPKLARPGRTLWLDPSYGGDTRAHPMTWKLPAKVKRADAREDPRGVETGGFLATPSAFPKAATAARTGHLYVQLDRSVPDAIEQVRTAAAQVSPRVTSFSMAASKQAARFATVRTGLFVGAACVLVLIGASLLVSQLEQLRERKKLLSSLVAFGTRRRTLSLSVLWQTAVPIVLGLVLASAVGLTLGAVLLGMAARPARVDWASVASMSGIGAVVVLLVTALSLPPLLKLMRPEGLRTE